jgi:hypothetical protein
MQTVDYPTFLATVVPDDLAMLTSFLVGVEVQGDPATAPGLLVQAQRLYDAGLVTEFAQRRYDVSGATWEGFLGKVAPIAVGYVGQLARERVTLSRDPLP